MHVQARDFTLFVKNILTSFFVNKRVLDVGSGDINGNNRFLFENLLEFFFELVLFSRDFVLHFPLFVIQDFFLISNKY